MTTPRILVMANHIDGLGGAERVSHGVAAGLAARGYDVALRGIRPTAEYRMPMTDTTYSTGFMSPVAEKPPGEKPWPAARRTAMRAEALDALRATLEDYREDLLICMQVFVAEHVADVGFNDLIRSGPRMIGMYHSSYEAAHTTKDFDRIGNVYRRIDKFLLLTPQDAEAFRRHNFNNTGWMPNPLSLVPASVSGSRDKRVVGIARYDELKQLDHALTAWASVSPDFPDWRFELYGEGPDRERLQRVIDDLGIQGTARLMGVTDDVEGVLLRSKLSVLCSRYEGLPMTLAESMACGVPAVTYDCSPGVRAIVTDGETGVVVPQNHVSGLAQALSGLMADDEQWGRMSRAAAESAVRFSPDRVMDRWEDLIARTMR
ncbi:glycosyltransferase [Pedococcus sp. KACC 23699]|uniref:Glycosyltransferase n=1 Tax=Pedococcus sp. KACC 23699 TaxID=3149228 RepID=A0AAU7JW30_9MICO